MVNENLFANIVRVGVVSSIDATKRKVRVIFPDKGFVSGWLTVLQQNYIWMPKINDVVICLYIPVENGDGFVLASSNGTVSELAKGDKGDKGDPGVFAFSVNDEGHLILSYEGENLNFEINESGHLICHL